MKPKKYHDFIARIRYRKTEEGSKPTAPPVADTIIVFKGLEQQFSRQEFIGYDSLFPKNSIKAGVSIIQPGFYREKFFVGQKFTFEEAGELVATGEIIEILNSDLIRTTV